MNAQNKEHLYDKISRALTNYEDADTADEPDDVWDLYVALVEVQNEWDELTGEEQT